MARVPRRSKSAPLAWLVNSTALEEAATLDDLRDQIGQLTEAGVPTSAIFRVFDLAQWYRKKLSEPEPIPDTVPGWL